MSIPKPTRQTRICGLLVPGSDLILRRAIEGEEGPTLEFKLRHIAAEQQGPTGFARGVFLVVDSVCHRLHDVSQVAKRTWVTRDADSSAVPHLVYFSNGPVLLIRAEESRVLFGFWRGKRLRELDERLQPGGNYEMANIVLVEFDKISPARVKKLVQAAIDLNHQLGDPTAAAKSP